MERLVFDSIPETIQDLGTGHSLVHINVQEEADNQVSALVVRVEHPVTRDRVVAAFIRAEFDDDAREAALRKGITSKTNADYVAFNKYSENVKKWCTEAGIV
jgi:hypothetical protein